MFLLVAVLGYLAAAVELALPPWVVALTLVPVLAVVVAASASRSAHQRRRQQHALFQAAVQVHAAASADELVQALELHGSALVSTGLLQVCARPPGAEEVGCAIPGESGRWVVARRAPAPASQRIDQTAVESLAALAAAALVRVRLSEESERHALVDALTGLPNRRHFTAALERCVAEGASVAVLFADLDGFKAVNDTLGHAAGDELLQEAARRLAQAVGADGLPARLGGDEFAVLLPDRLPGLVEDVGEAVVACLREPFLLSAGPATIGASVGVTTSVRDDDADSLLSRADAAMYVAKRSGGSRSVLAGDEA
nr:GGDEF domain-containing protein [Kineococcus vitellinus]